MAKKLLKILLTAFIVLLLLPIVLVALVVVWQIVGMAVNRHATDVQTSALVRAVEESIPGATVIDVYSETGNTSGTGNHVDCLSRVVFSADLDEDTVRSKLAGRFGEHEMRLTLGDDGNFTVQQVTSAPFRDNIEGH